MTKKLFAAAALAILALTATSGTAHADINNFRIVSYDIQYTLSKDTTNRSTLQTEETITANFVVPNQNRGIERSIPTSYDGHPTNLSIASVTDGRNASLPYTTYQSGDNTVLRIGDKNRYVHGLQTYKITYTQKDVTKHYTDNNRDEFYWDTNGTDWRVPIDALSVRLTLDDSIADKVQGGSCYIGAANATNQCKLEHSENTFNTQAINMAAGENITIAIGFPPNTFATYQQTFIEKLRDLWLVGLFLSAIISPIVLIIIMIRYFRWKNRSSELGSIVTEFTPPKDTSVTTAAYTLGTANNFAAQLLDFAVRHYIKIIETKPKSFWRPAEYDIEITKDVSQLLKEEQEILSDVFGHLPVVGEKLALKSLRNSAKFSARLTDNAEKLVKLARHTYGLRAKDESKSQWLFKWSRGLLIAAVITLNPIFLISAIIIFICSKTLWPLTDKGLALKRYLLGLREYIKVAEADRLKMLQSPEGVQKVGAIDPSDSTVILQLYEKALPYAVLFGQEKEWNKQLGHYYEATNTTPTWYGGSTAFNSAVLASSISSFSASANTYGNSYNSSSSGSSGDGSSGGGGGGGGGGGW